MSDQAIREGRAGARWAVFGLVVAYVGLLKWAYVHIVYPVFGYMGLQMVSLGGAGESLSWALALAPVAWLPVDIDRPSRLPIWFQYLVVYIPIATIGLYNTGPSDPSTWPLVIVVLLAIIIVQAIAGLPTLRVPRLRTTRATLPVVLLGAGAFLAAIIIKTFGLPTSLPTIADVYGVRSQFRLVIESAGPLAAYATAWFARVVCPLLVVLGLVDRKWTLALLGFAGSALVFAITGLKSVALSGFFLVGLAMIFGRRGRGMGLRITAALTGVVALAATVYAVTGLKTLAALFIQRGLVTPGLLSVYYYQFFSTHPQAHLGASIFSHITAYPYDAAPPFLIGGWYFGDVTQSANANVWADAFANFGFGGIIVTAVIFGAVLWLFDGITAGRRRAVACLMLGVPALMLTNSGLTTVLLTHGLVLTLGLGALLDDEQPAPIPGAAAPPPELAP